MLEFVLLVHAYVTAAILMHWNVKQITSHRSCSIALPHSADQTLSR